MDRGAWRATAHGVAKCQTRLSDWAHSPAVRVIYVPHLPYPLLCWWTLRSLPLMSRETFKMRGFLILKHGDNQCLSELSWRVRRKYAYSNYRGMKNTGDSQYIGLNGKLGFSCFPISGIWCLQGLGNAVPTWKAVGVSFSVRSCSQFFQTWKLSHIGCVRYVVLSGEGNRLCVLRASAPDALLRTTRWAAEEAANALTLTLSNKRWVPCPPLLRASLPLRFSNGSCSEWGCASFLARLFRDW